MVRSWLRPPHTEHDSSCSPSARCYPSYEPPSTRSLLVWSGAVPRCSSLRASGGGPRTRGPRGRDPVGSGDETPRLKCHLEIWCGATGRPWTTTPGEDAMSPIIPSTSASMPVA